MNLFIPVRGTADSESANTICDSRVKISSLNILVAAIILLQSVNMSAHNVADPCPPPDDWTVNPAEFAYNGQVTVKVYVDDLPVESGYLGAFVGEECRGLIEASYFPPQNHYVFELLCYSNDASGELMSFRYFDSQSCETLKLFTESVEFISDMTLGDAVNPFELHYPGTISFDKSFVSGWTWFSVNALGEDMSLGDLLTCVSETDFIMSQTLSATYTVGDGWVGSMEDAGGIASTSLYKINTIDPCGVSYVGIPVDTSSTPIDIVPGWNWIGYLPQCIIPITDALESLTVQAGDYIKNQTESATYYDGFGWYGSMEELTPGDGYMLRKMTADALVYPECPPAGANAKKTSFAAPDTSLNPHQFEYNGTLTAKVYVDGVLAGDEEDLVLAYVDDQLRGIMGGIYFEPTQAYAYPLMVYSNLAEGEILTFRYYDAGNDRLHLCDETLAFTENMIVANALESFELHVSSPVGLEDPARANGLSLDVVPNPFYGLLQIEYSVAEKSSVRIAVHDMLGKLLEVLDERTLNPGSYATEWNADGYTNGTFILKLNSDKSSMIRKVMLIR